jgi:transposase-like protein
MTKNIQTAKLNAAIDMLIESDADLSNVLGKEGLIKQLSKRILERALEAEMQSHLGYERYNRSDIDNARNGSYQKNLITNNGQIELTVPRDRKGQFEPVIVKKKQSRIDGLDEKIISLYAKGMSISDIKIQLEELYGAEVSESLISRVTDDVIDEVKALVESLILGLGDETDSSIREQCANGVAEFFRWFIKLWTTKKVLN